MMGILIQDLQLGLRMLGKRPGFTAVAVITMALGIGANTAIFSVINAVLLRPLPYPEEERLLVIEERPWLPVPAYLAWRDQSEAMERISAYYPRRLNLTLKGEADVIEGMEVGPDFLRLLGANFAAGRAFEPGDLGAGDGPVAIVSHGFWQRRFGGAPTVIGSAITLDGIPHTVVGVTRSGFEVIAPQSERPEVWVSLPLVPVREDGAFNYVVPMARLGRGVALEAAQSEFDAILDGVEAEYPDLFEEIGRRTALGPLREPLVSPFRSGLLLLMSAVGCLLLIACCNVGNLLLARAVIRQPEIAVRAVLGASRLRLLRQLLTESVLLSLLGGALGVLFVWWGIDLIVALVPDDLSSVGQIRLDRDVLAFTLGLAMLAGIGFGVAPGLAGSRPDLHTALKGGGRGGAPHRRPLFSLLVITEVSIALVLMVGAGLLINSYVRLFSVDPGFDPENVLTARIAVPQDRYASMRDLSGFYETVLQEVSAIPDVLHAGIANNLPIQRSNSRRNVEIEGREPFTPDFGVVSPDYFRAVGIPLQQGRPFEATDNAGSPRVAIVDAALAREIWPADDPLGKRFRFAGEPEWLTVVGVVGNVRGLGLAGPLKPGFYIPYPQRPDSLVERLVGSTMMLAIRTRSEPSAVADSLRRAVFRVDPAQALAEVASLNEVIAQGVAPQRFRTLLLSIFGLLALTLSAVGIYGVISFWISQRTREIGIRSALGALPRDVLALIVREGMTLAAIGVAVGLIAAWMLTRFLSGFLFGITPTDPATFAAVGLLLVSVSLLASWVAARRAASVDPIKALHCE